jgi:hypothetical protein
MIMEAKPTRLRRRRSRAVEDRYTNTSRAVEDRYYKYQQSGRGSLYKYQQTAVGDRFTNTHMDSIGVNTMEAAVIPIELGVDLPAIRYLE